MTRNQAIQRIWTYRAFGVVIAVVGLTLLFVGLLKGLYYAEPSGSFIQNATKNIVAIVYHKIPVISPIIAAAWPYAPGFSLFPLLSVNNIPLLVIYVALWGGGFLFRAAQNLAAVVKAVDYQNAVDGMRGSRRRPDSREELNIPQKATFLGQVHENYIAPLIVTVVAGIILFVFNMN